MSQICRTEGNHTPTTHVLAVTPCLFVSIVVVTHYRHMSHRRQTHSHNPRSSRHTIPFCFHCSSKTLSSYVTDMSHRRQSHSHNSHSSCLTMPFCLCCHCRRHTLSSYVTDMSLRRQSHSHNSRSSCHTMPFCLCCHCRRHTLSSYVTDMSLRRQPHSHNSRSSCHTIPFCFHCSSNTLSSYVSDMSHRRQSHSHNSRSSCHTIPVHNRSLHNITNHGERYFFIQSSAQKFISNDLECTLCTSSHKEPICPERTKSVQSSTALICYVLCKTLTRIASVYSADK